MPTLLNQVLEIFPVATVVIWGLLMCWYYWNSVRIQAVAWKVTFKDSAIILLERIWFILFALVSNKKDVANKWLDLCKRAMANGYRGGVVWLGPKPIFVVVKPTDVQAVLNKTTEVGPDADVMKIFIGSGLLVAPASVWKVSRPYLVPFFHARNVEKLVPRMNQSGRDLAHNLSKHAGSGPYDVLDDIGRVTLKSSLCILFGPDFELNMQPEETITVLRNINRIGDFIVNRLFNIWLWPDIIFRIVYRKELKRIAFCLHGLLHESSKVEGYATDKYDNHNQHSDEIGKISYLTMKDALQNKNPKYPDFTQKDVRNEMISTLIAATDTTQMTMGACLMALAANPTVQERLYNEVTATLGMGDRDVTAEDFKNMPYLDQVLRETLRKFVIVGSITRVTHKDLKLSFCTVPAGGAFVVPIAAVHFDPVAYPEPEIFDPDRHCMENKAQRNKYSFIPFLAGPRNCIGKHFSTLHMKILVTHVVRNLRLKTSFNINKKLTYTPGLVFKLQNGYAMEVEKRK